VCARSARPTSATCWQYCASGMLALACRTTILTARLPAAVAGGGGTDAAVSPAEAAAVVLGDAGAPAEAGAPCADRSDGLGESEREPAPWDGVVLYFGEEVAQRAAWGTTWRDIVPGPSVGAELRARAAGFDGLSGTRLASVLARPVASYCGPLPTPLRAPSLMTAAPSAMVVAATRAAMTTTTTASSPPRPPLPAALFRQAVRADCWGLDANWKPPPREAFVSIRLGALAGQLCRGRRPSCPRIRARRRAQ
jgi:hypothetical protein